MQLSVRHVTRYGYSPEATSAAFKLRLWPVATAAQAPEDWQVSVNGDPVKPLLREASGDRVGLWHHHRPVGSVEIVAEGTVATTDTAGVVRGLIETVPPAVYLRATRLTKDDDGIGALAAEVATGSPLDRLHGLSATVYDAIAYRPGATTAETTAAEAAAMGAGVCQDQAHVFIAAARSLGIPARYVVGYLVEDNLATAETHAWVEAHVAGLGWTGFDVTHQLCPTDGYVRLACGFDADDAAPIRGTVSGNPEAEMSTEVAISHAASQSQQ